MTSAPVPVRRARESDAELRDQLSSLQGLLALSMLMTESGDEQRILHLGSSAVPSLGRCHLAGVDLFDTGWHAVAGACADPGVRADVEAQFAVLTTAGGAVAILHEAWGWAFPLRSVQGHFGFLVVAADEEPSPSEQFLLRVLAQQTGVALANARMHTRERQTAAELQAVNVQLADTVTALQRSTDIHARLTRVAVAGEGREGIAGAVHDLTGYPVAIEDGHGNLCAWAGPGPPEPYPRVVPAVREQTLQRALRDGRPMRDGSWLLTVAQPRSDVIGVLALFDPSATAGRQEQAALEHGATVLAMELARLQSVAETEVRLRRSVVDELLAGTNEPGLLGRAQALGYDLERPHRVVLVAPEGPQPDMETFFDAVRRAARDTGVGTLLSERGGTVVVLADADRRWDDFRAAVLRELSGGRCRVGVGAVCDRALELPRSHHEAQLALRMQDASGARDCAVVFDELGVYRILAEVDDPASVERFTRQWLTELIDYDARRRSDLVRTLSTYLECGGRYDSTAAALATHRSTLKYRLQRIKEISGHDLSDADTRFNLQLATRAWYTLLALGGGRT